MKALVDYFESKYEKDQTLIDEDILNNERQIALMKEAYNELKQLLIYANMGTELDLLSSNLYEVYHSLSEIIGKSYEDDLIDHL